MQVSPQYKRFKHSPIMGDTFTLPDMRSSIIRTMQGYHRYTNTVDLKSLEKEPQNKGNENQKTDRINSVYDRAILALSYADTVIFSGHIARPGEYVLHVQVNTKPKTYLIIEMIPFLVYYSYARKYHLLSLMYNPGYQCTNMFINVEIWTSMDRHSQ